MKYYASYEEGKVYSFSDLQEFFQTSEGLEDDRNAGTTFELWFTDCINRGLLIEIDVFDIVNDGNELGIIQKNSDNDFEIFWTVADYSIRGEWAEIIEEIEEHTK